MLEVVRTYYFFKSKPQVEQLKVLRKDHVLGKILNLEAQSYKVKIIFRAKII